MALAEAHLAKVYNRPGHDIIDHYTYAIVTDGDLMEGVASEAASLAGHLSLGKLIYLYDDNHISIEGSTDFAFTEDRGKRFEAYGWHVQRVEDGLDVEAIDRAIQAAKLDPRPSLIMVPNIIGYGLPTRQGTAKAHGEPPGDVELNGAKDQLGWPKEPRFYVPEDALAFFRQAVTQGAEQEKTWRAKFEAYQTEYPELAAELERRLAGETPGDRAGGLPRASEAHPSAVRIAFDGAAALFSDEAERTWRAGLEGREMIDWHGVGEQVAQLLARAPKVTQDPEHVTGTVNVIAQDAQGHIASAVSTSGWAWKYPGRLGDSPIIGAGNYADDRYGAAACTGWGEAAHPAGAGNKKKPAPGL